MRDTTEFDAAAKHAIQTNTDEEPTVLIEFTITHWRFKPNWNASLFNKIYEDQSVIIPSSPATIPSNTSKDNVLRSSFRDLFIQAYTGDPPSITAKLLPVQPAEANVTVIVSSDSTGLVHTKTTVSNPVKTPLHSTAPNASRYTWTWNYFSNSELVSFRRIPSDSFLRATSSSPPGQRQEKSSIVTAPSVSPSAQTRFGHHPAPPWVQIPANFRWTFNPQSETVTFHRLSKPAPVPPKPSLHLPLPKANHTGIIHASASPTFDKHSASPSHFCCAIYSNPNQNVFCITKQHRDALKIKIYHLYVRELFRGVRIYFLRTNFVRDFNTAIFLDTLKFATIV
eukprot:jgi/Psemu1/51759/gm1.51759_g